ncbi:monocarboxylate transporter 14 [Platysternon megacephalum]|uniref:Monocarboxylate transporter 14 n=1 Tax=Platysternon megacephalum TaxID=55544 RepID=A0A4D9E614_9SAUR|nr:monocarboxylate transporter 14 [Platysternon megacephalum]
MRGLAGFRHIQDGVRKGEETSWGTFRHTQDGHNNTQDGSRNRNEIQRFATPKMAVAPLRKARPSSGLTQDGGRDVTARTAEPRQAYVRACRGAR